MVGRINQKTLTIRATEFDRFSALLDQGISIPGIKRDEVLFQETVTFDDGCQMDIKVVNGSEEDGPWTEGVLFNQRGIELGCTEVGEELGGEYIIPCDEDDKYICVVQRSAR